MSVTLKKRDCDVNITLTPSGTQYLCFEIDIQGDHLKFLSISAVGGQFGDIVSTLYNLFYEDDDGHDDFELSATEQKNGALVMRYKRQGE